MFACLVVCGASSACQDEGYRVVVQAPNDTRIARAEVSVLDSCADLSILGEAPRVALARAEISGGRSEPIGAVPEGVYGLYARAWDQACRLVFAGCREVSLEGGGRGTLVVELEPVEAPPCAGACVEGLCAGEGGDDGGVDRDGGGDPDAGAADAGPSCDDPPTVVGGVETGGWAVAVAVDGSTAVVTNWELGVAIVDVSEPATPAVVGSVDTEAWAYCAELTGTVAYVCDDNAGLWLIDVAIPSAPEVLSRVDTPGFATDVTVAGTVAFVADWFAGLQVVDISDVEAARTVGTLDTQKRNVGAVAAQGSTLLLGMGDEGLWVLDVSVPSEPAVVTVLDTPDAAGKAVFSGSTAFVSLGESGLHVIDVSDPAAPAIVGSVDLSEAGDLAFREPYVFVTSGTGGLSIVDVTDRESPTLVATVDTRGSAMGVALTGRLALVSSGFDGLQIVDLGCYAP